MIHKTIHRVPGDQASESANDLPIVVILTLQQRSQQVLSMSNTPTKSTVTVDDHNRVIDIGSTGITLSYDLTEIRMKSGERMVIRYHNASDMAHNLVIVNSESDINPVGIAALSAQQDEFIPKSEQDRILAASRVGLSGRHRVH